VKDLSGNGQCESNREGGGSAQHHRQGLCDETV
jgi:hypothetical protein